MILIYNDNDKLQSEVILGIYSKINEKYLTKGNMLRAIVSGNSKVIRITKIVGVLGDIIENSVRIQDYHRAAKYLFVYEKLCSKYFNEKNISNFEAEACKRFKLPCRNNA